MFDPGIIESHPEREKIREAVATLAATGILNQQREALFARLLNGSASESKENLAEKILEHRKSEHALISLQQLGERIIKEQEDEQG